MNKHSDKEKVNNDHVLYLYLHVRWQCRNVLALDHNQSMNEYHDEEHC